MHGSGRLRRPAALLVAIATLICGAGLAWNYPGLASPWAVLVFSCWVALVYLLPYSSLLLLPALLPIVGFAPWTGWLTFEEFDILVLGAVASGYLRIARGAASFQGAGLNRGKLEHAARLSPSSTVLLCLFALSAAVALYRGFYSTGAASLGWWQAYYDPLNSWRIFKGFAFAALLAPLLANMLDRASEQVVRLFSLGTAIGLAGVSVAVVWERMAFTGLLNFSADYRVTALFWEMHVGGAALDGFLALTLPLAFWHLSQARHGVRVALSMLLLGLAAYACLVTFSRGLYAGLLVATALVAVLRWRQIDRQSRPPAGALLFKGVAFVVVSIAVAFLVFRSGGYRMVGAALVIFAISLLQYPLAHRATWLQWSLATVLGVLLGMVGWVVSASLYKGPYLLFAIAGTCGALLAVGFRTSRNNSVTVVMLSTYVWGVIAAAKIADHWGGADALRDGVLALCVLVGVGLWHARGVIPLWSTSIRTTAVSLGAAASIAATVAVFSGGAYMGDRFATVERDLAGRVNHWQEGLNMLDGPLDWLFGAGLGRYPAGYFFELPDRGFPGSHRLVNERGTAYLAVGGPRHMLGFGELYRISQRLLVASSDRYSVTLDARANDESSLHIEICEKHLLYSAGCAIAVQRIEPSQGGWQRVEVPLDISNLKGGPWYAPRLVAFSLAVNTKGRLVEIDNVAVEGLDGTNKIENGDFSAGMAHWFFTSDREHLPWHIKNLYLNVLFEQGAWGLILFTLLIGSALWHLTVGVSRSHPLAPYLAGSLAAFLVTGLFDSLLDVPRVSFLFYVILLMSLMRHPIAKAGPSVAIRPAMLTGAT